MIQNMYKHIFCVKGVIYFQPHEKKNHEIPALSNICSFIRGVSKRVTKTKLLLHAKYLRYLHNFFTVLLEHPSGFCIKFLKCQCWPHIFIFSNYQYQAKQSNCNKYTKYVHQVKGMLNLDYQKNGQKQPKHVMLFFVIKLFQSFKCKVNENRTNIELTVALGKTFMVWIFHNIHLHRSQLFLHFFYKPSCELNFSLIFKKILQKARRILF